MIKKTRYFIEYLLLRGVVGIINRLSEKHVRAVASFFGHLWYALDPKHRAIAQANIQSAFPGMSGDNRTRILKESYVNIIETFMIFPRMARFDSTVVEQKFTFECEDYYEEAVRRGKGVFLLTGHIGNWEFAAAAHSIRHHGLVAVAKDIHNPSIDAYIKSLRRNALVEVVRPRNAVFRLLRSLKQGKTIAMLLDQNTLKHEAVFVDFFGRPAATQYAMALMALKTGAAVVPGFITRNAVTGGYIIRYEKPLSADDVQDRDAAVQILTQHYTAILEHQIRRAPALWFWVHNRFKTTP